MNRFERWLCAALLVLAPSALQAQSTPLWKELQPARVMKFSPTPVGTVLVQLKTGLFAVNPETGQHVWSRPDVTDYVVVSGTPFVYFVTASGDTIGDLETGRDRWALSSLGFSSIKGKMHLPAEGLILVYGATAESPQALVAAKYETGEVMWKQPQLFTDPVLAKKAAKIQYRDYLVDADHTIVLDPSDDGLIRLDLQTGRVLWRLSQAALASKGKWLTLRPAGNLVLATYEKKVFAVNRETGQIAWSRDAKFPSAITQAAATPAGVLVRGAYNIDGKGNATWKPYLALLDPGTGTSKWTNEKAKFQGRSEFLIEGATATVALKQAVATIDVASGQVLKTTNMPEFSGGESPCCLERMGDGRLRVWSSQNLRLFEPTGPTVYSVYLKPPGASFLAKLATVALAVAATSMSYAAAPPGGFYTVYSPGPGSALFAKFKASTDAENYSYVFTEESGSRPDRFALVRIDKATGKDTGRLRFTDRSPTFKLDPASGIVMLLDDNTLSALKFAPQVP